MLELLKIPSSFGTIPGNQSPGPNLERTLHKNAAILEGFIVCPTKKKRIEIREKPIAKKVYENTRETLLFMDPDAKDCSDCLYKALVALIKSLDEM